MKRWLHLPLFLLVIGVSFAPSDYLGSLILDAASAQCPEGTFLSGAVHSFWKDWTVVILATELAMAAMSYILHFGYFSEDVRSKFFPWPWPRWGIITFCATLVTGGFCIWITHASQFCLARDGIYHRALPWQELQRHPWPDLVRIDVSCANRRREPDLDYVLTMKDGSAIDIADAWPNWKALAAFDHYLVGTHFFFHADIQKSCPSYFADWVGERP